MISIIKTAIITIIISFISGLLLEYYKNLAPRILCNIGKGTPLVINNKKICAYILTVRNISNKTIHEITLNIQGSKNNLKIGDAKITKGLKFDSSIKDNILDVYIPFLSKDDEFSATLYVENRGGEYDKPVVTIRSPENFKEVDSAEQKGVLSLLFNISKNINKPSDTKKTINRQNGEVFQRNKKFSKNKKAMIAIASIILVISIGVLGALYFQDEFNNTQTPDAKTSVEKQSTDATESADGTTKNAGEKASTGGTSKSTGVKGSTGGTTKNTGTKTSSNGTNVNTDTKALIDGTTGNADTKTSTGETTENTDTKTSTGGTTGSTDTKTSTGGTTENTDTKTSTGGTTGSTDTKTSTGGTTGSTDTKTSTGGTTGNTDTKTSTGGTAGSASN
jgi:hypothetical protein